MLRKGVPGKSVDSVNAELCVADTGTGLSRPTAQNMEIN